ncbi:hypothetical protein [Caldovatus aquaticus]|uniref:Uncharacterized protein n=1 Tax=Caldovatus aquaticus TaxID=2865671 RepID=A0ABS7F6C3_9PROT|nr:hypothetical protein [Caldovatus aquaticus]MBW8270340.1 hypothetical protein [Caldovatus aquaticus]
MKRLRRFWKALDEVPGAATDRLEWTDVLGAEWHDIEPYLKSTGRRTTAVMCPYPGGDGCPRRVVTGANGAIRAVCGSRPRMCDALDLKAADVTILALDRAKLLRELARAFDAEPADRPVGSGRVMLVGRRAVAAGFASPILLALPGQAEALAEDDLRQAGLDPAGSVVLVPRPLSLPTAFQTRLTAAGHQVIPLSEAVGLGATGFEALQPPAILLAPIREALAARTRTAGPQPVWELPPDATWGELTFTLVADEVLNVSFRSQTRRLEPDHLGMKDGRSGKPTEAWVFLQALARVGGSLGPMSPDVVEDYKKDKQALTKRLREAFRIQGDPIRWNRRTRSYQTAFVMRDERPKAVRMSSPRR